MSKKVFIGASVLAGAVVLVLVIMRWRNTQKPVPAVTTIPTASITAPSPSRTATPTATATPTPSPTKTATPTPSPTITPTPTPTPTQSNNPPSTPTPTPTPTSTPTPTPTPGPQTYDIRIENNAYYPGTLNVKQGDIVRFTNDDSVDHDAVDGAGKWSTPIISPNESYNLDTSDIAVGTYRYHDSVILYMFGTLRIYK
jgi:plastocyanin